MRRSVRSSFLPTYGEHGQYAINTGMQDNRLIVGDDNYLWAELAHEDVCAPAPIDESYEIDEHTMLAFLHSGVSEAHLWAEAFNNVAGEEVILILPDAETGSATFALRQSLELQTA